MTQSDDDALRRFLGEAKGLAGLSKWILQYGQPEGGILAKPRTLSEAEWIAKYASEEDETSGD